MSQAIAPAGAVPIKIESFADLMHKLQEAGHKDDIRVPLRVLRGELACDNIDVPDLV